MTTESETLDAQIRVHVAAKREIENTIIEWERKRKWRENEIARLSKLRTESLNFTLSLNDN